jgi:WD40 repeat protein
MTISRSLVSLTVLVVLAYCVFGGSAFAADKLTAVTDGREALPGLVPAPRPLPGVGRWQLAYRLPRGRITAIAWSPDGTRIAYRESNSVRICDAKTFETQHVLVGHSQRVQSIDWNRANNRIASASLDGTVRIWSADGVPQLVLKSPAWPINCAAWSPDGKRLAWAGADGAVRIVQADGKPIRTIAASKAAINCLAWNPNGTQFVVGDDKHFVKIWNADGSPAAVFVGYKAPVSIVAWSPDGKRIATATSGVYSVNTRQYSAEVRIWNTNGQSIFSRVDEKEVFGVQWNPDGSSLAVLRDAGELQTLNAAGEPQSEKTIPSLDEGTVRPSMAWAGDGKKIAFGGLHQIVVLDVETNGIRESKAAYTLPNLTYADWSAAGNRIALVTVSGVEFRRPDGTLAGSLDRLIRSGDCRGQFAWSPDGKRVVVIPVREPIAVREPLVTDVDGGPATLPFEFPDAPSRVAWNAKTGLFASVAENSIRIVKPGDALQSTFPAPAAVDSVRWNAAGDRLAVLHVLQPKTLFGLQVYDSRGKSIAVLKELPGEVDAMDISPDGKTVLIGYDAGNWEAWDLNDTTRPKRSSPAHSFGSCMDVTYSPDGSQFATTGWDGLVKLWSADGTLVRTYDGHDGPIYSASFSPDGSHFVTAGQSSTVRIWSTKSERAETIISFASADESVVITADGRFLSGNPNVIDSEFLFLAEKPNGAMQSFDYAEFRKRTGEKELKASLVRARRPRVTRGTLAQRNDPNFDVSVPHPAYTDKHPAVLFDEAHRNFHTANGRYKAFGDLIANDGYRVTSSREPFTPRRLDEFDLLIIANAQGTRGQSKSAFTRAECDGVENWVRGGGALLLVTDHEPYGSGSEELGKAFGVEMSRRVTVDSSSQSANGLLFSRNKHQLGDHAILRGRNESERVNRVLTFTGQSLKGPPDSVPLLRFADTAVDVGPDQRTPAAGRAQGIALKFGRGRVVVLGEAGQLSAQVYGDPPNQIGMNVPGCDNRKLALNIVHWLSGLID